MSSLLGITAASGVSGADANKDELSQILADCGITSNPSQPSTQANSSQNYPEEEEKVQLSAQVIAETEGLSSAELQRKGAIL